MASVSPVMYVAATAYERILALEWLDPYPFIFALARMSTHASRSKGEGCVLTPVPPQITPKMGSGRLCELGRLPRRIRYMYVHRLLPPISSSCTCPMLSHPLARDKDLTVSSLHVIQGIFSCKQTICTLGSVEVLGTLSWFC